MALGVRIIGTAATMQGIIARNLETVRRRIAEAAERGGRSAQDVTLVAVTKLRSAEEIRDLLSAGQRVLGENRVQEALEKIAALADDEPLEPPIEWHLIGHLQTNKARKIIDKVALVHSLDSLRLAEAIQREAERANRTVEVLLQVGVSGEESKFGVCADDVESVASGLRPFDRLRCTGLMTMAPLVADPEETRPMFRALRRAFERLRERGEEHLDLRRLSMGMTNDFEVAVEEGATLVRIGTALFEGSRASRKMRQGRAAEARREDEGYDNGGSVVVSN